MTGFRQDVRHALRLLARSPGFTLAVVLTLALALGLGTTAFALVNAVVLRPLPVEDPEDLAYVYTATEEGFLSHGPLAFPDFEDLRDRAEGFGRLAAYALQPVSLEAGDRPELVMAEVVTGEYFATLGVDTALGRVLAVEDDRGAGGSPVVVLGHSLWRGRFGGDPAVLGRQVRLAGHPFTVVGVAPKGFGGLTRGLAAELWIPARAAERLPAGVTVGFGEPTPGVGRLDDRARRWVWVVGRLRPGETVSRTRAELEALAGRLAAEHPATHRERRFAVLPVAEVRVLPGVDGVLRVGSAGLLVVAGLVLLVAASNVANLFLARAVERRREVVTRLSLGAGRWRLVRQLLVEGAAFAACGGAGGLLLAAAARRLAGVVAPALPWPVEPALQLPLDWRVFLFALAASLGTVLVFGLAPALELVRPELGASLREEGATATAPGGRRGLANALVVLQVSLSLVLLVATGLTVRSLLRAQRIDPGFEPAGVVVATLAPELQGYTPAETEGIFRRLRERLDGLPDVVSTAEASHLPLTLGLRMGSVAPAGVADRGAERAGWTNVDEALVGPGYFETLGIGLTAGRGFRPGDDPGSPPVAVVNETLAARLWPGRDAVERRLRVAGAEREYRVVGVARDGKYRTLGEPTRPFLYRPLAQGARQPVGTRSLAVRVAGNPAAALGAVRRAVREVDPALPVQGLRTYAEALEGALLLPRAGAALFGAFSVLAASLAVVGIHGLLAHAAARRRREIGVRMALGAGRRDVVALVVGQGARLAAVGLVLGLGVAFLATRGLRALLYGTSPTDPATFVVVPALLFAVALVASYLPARRASRSDPAEVLRDA